MQWVTLCLDVRSILAEVADGAQLQSIDSVEVMASCRLRQVVVLDDLPAAEDGLPPLMVMPARLSADLQVVALSVKAPPASRPRSQEAAVRQRLVVPTGSTRVRSAPLTGATGSAQAPDQEHLFVYSAAPRTPPLRQPNGRQARRAQDDFSARFSDLTSRKGSYETRHHLVSVVPRERLARLASKPDPAPLDLSTFTVAEDAFLENESWRVELSDDSDENEVEFAAVSEPGAPKFSHSSRNRWVVSCLVGLARFFFFL